MEEYKKYEKMIYKLSWKYARIGYPLDELVSEANWAYMRAKKTFNPDKGKFGTHLYNSIRGHLHNLTKPSNNSFIELEQEESPIKMNNFAAGGNPEKRVILKDQIEKANNDCTVTVNLIFQMPPELYALCNEVSCPKLTKRRLYRYLKNYKGWEHKRIKKALNEIETIMRST